jgi:hypothetical protein
LLKRSDLLTFMISLSCVSSWLLTPVAAAQTDVRKNECLLAYADAQEQRMRGALLAAREQLLQCSSNECPRPIEHDCSEWLREVEGDLSSVVFAVSDEGGHDLPSAIVQVNGKPLSDLSEGRAQLLDPGSYDYSVEAPGFLRLDGTLVMRQSEKNRIVRVQLERLGAPQPTAAAVALLSAAGPSDSSFHVPTASIVLGATALVGMAGFAYFGLRGHARRDDAERCTSDCAALIDSGKRDYIVADISLAAAVAAAGTALAIALLDQHAASPPTQETPTMHLAVGPTNVQWNMRF